MALIGQHQQTAFANPQNGQAPDADVIRANDNAVTSKHNAHDADATIHVQTGLLSARPAAGTAGAVYVDENRRFYVDNGSAWAEVPYARLDAAGTNSFTNNVTVGGTLTVTTGLTDVMNVDAANIIADSVTTGAVAGGAITGTSVNVSGTATASSFSGAGTGLTGIPAGQLTGALPAISAANLTNIPAANITGTLPAISGANLTNLNGSNIGSGTVAAARLPTSYTALTVTTLTTNTIERNLTLTFGQIDLVNGRLVGTNGATKAGPYLSVDASASYFLDMNAQTSLPWYSTGTSAGSGGDINQGPSGLTTMAEYRWIRLRMGNPGQDFYIRCERWT